MADQFYQPNSILSGHVKKEKFSNIQALKKLFSYLIFATEQFSG